MGTCPLRTVRQPASDVNAGRRHGETPRPILGRVGPGSGACQSQTNFAANTAAMTSTPAEQSLPRPASTLMPT